MKNIVWLDLEETLIDSWGEFNILDQKVENIKTLLKKVKPDEMSVWSFAIWTEKDIARFNTNGIKQQLEDLLEFKFSNIHTIDEMQKMVEQYDGFKYVNTVEFIQINQKLWSFVKYCFNHNNTNFWLIDDCIPNMTIQNKDNNVTINCININTGFQNNSNIPEYKNQLIFQSIEHFHERYGN